MLKQIISNKYFVLGVRLVIGGVFIWASVYKIAEPGEFAKSIYNYRMMPDAAINLMAIVMPWLELVCGVLLIIGPGLRGSALLIGLMLLVFIVAISTAIARGLDIDCGCFRVGDGGRIVGLKTLVEDVLMLVGVGIILAFGGPSFSLRKINPGFK
ncbi:MAG: MauE/DoxX family redox-associated membrane protein [bacterium]